MKKKIIVLLLLCSLIYIKPVSATTYSADVVWVTGTEIRLSVSISSTTLDTDYHSITITVQLLDLNFEAVDIHDIRVDFQIPGYYSNYVALDTISSIGGSSVKYTSIQYNTNWGTNYFQMKLSCRENIPLAIDPELFTDWGDFFIIYPYEPPTTPTTPTNPTTNENGLPKDIKLLLYILAPIGSLIFLGTIAASIIFLRRRSNTVQTSYTRTAQTAAVQSKFCTNCGIQLNNNESFCSNCGARNLEWKMTKRS
ncbi:MAG: zinc ribbon domain-containing protein [Candidatus Heimdallarchaeota archaeon]|nr:zinc ribbon domain-containing protein [Candidatus Heimdallarchaeota archaeon]MCK4612132.1 zinc ribbon domain-containing protein [Candidatus Heimdallarchaeota archaeon]